MIPLLYAAQETTFSNCGLGFLPDALSCTVYEAKNDISSYCLKMVYPVTGLHYADIIPERIIYAAPAPNKPPQPFRISTVSPPLSGLVEIIAPHVSAQLKSIITYGSTRQKSASNTIDYYVQQARNMGQTVPFTFSIIGGIDTARKISHLEPITLAEAIVGANNSLIDVFGGELEFDKWNVKLSSARGKGTGVDIRHGVNMTDFSMETTTSGMITACVPYWSGQVDNVDTVVVGDLCNASGVGSYQYKRVVKVSVMDYLELAQNTAPTKAQVTAAGQAWLEKNKQAMLTTIEAGMIEVIDNPTYDRNVYLCDTVTVTHPDFHVRETAKIVACEHNVLTDKYNKITIGTLRTTAAEYIAMALKRH